jgi:hypothetical protein
VGSHFYAVFVRRDTWVEISGEFIILGLGNEELCGLFGSPRIHMIVTPRDLRRTGCVSKMRLKETYTEFSWDNISRNGNLKNRQLDDSTGATMRWSV